MRLEKIVVGEMNLNCDILSTWTLLCLSPIVVFSRQLILSAFSCVALSVHCQVMVCSWQIAYEVLEEAITLPFFVTKIIYRGKERLSKGHSFHELHPLIWQIRYPPLMRICNFTLFFSLSQTVGYVESSNVEVDNNLIKSVSYSHTNIHPPLNARSVFAGNLLRLTAKWDENFPIVSCIIWHESIVTNLSLTLMLHMYTWNNIAHWGNIFFNWY